MIDDHQQTGNDGMWANRNPPLFIFPGVQSREMAAWISDQDMRPFDEGHAVLLTISGILRWIKGESELHVETVLQ